MPVDVDTAIQDVLSEKKKLVPHLELGATTEPKSPYYKGAKDHRFVKCQSCGGYIGTRPGVDDRYVGWGNRANAVVSVGPDKCCQNPVPVP